MRYLVAIVSFITLVSLTTGTSSADDWQYTTVDSGGSVGRYTSIALDSQDHPHISYNDSTNESLKYAKWTGDGWEIQTVYTFGDTYRFTSIALDSQDYPHISYYYNFYTYCHFLEMWYDCDRINYARWTGSAWDITVLGESHPFWEPYSLGKYCCIGLDSQDHPHLSYQYKEHHTPNRLGYNHWTGSTWAFQTIDSTGDKFRYISIALDSQDYPHISYCDKNVEDLKYAHKTISGWEIQTVESSGNVGYYSSIALDNQNHPNISYRGGGYLKYARWTGSEWEIQVVDSECVCGYTSIAIDSQNYPHISYFDDDNNNLKYARWTGSEWDTQTVDSHAYVGQYTSLALDSNDIPHISYFDQGNTNLKYAWYGDPFVDIILEYFSTKPNDSAIVLNWSVEITPPMAGDEHIAGFNLYRRPLSPEGENTYSRLDYWLKINTSLITGQNPFSYTDSSVESGVAYEYKLEAVLADDSPETLGTTQATAGLPPASFAILALYPNPASDMLTCLLAMPEVGIVQLTLYDLSGRLVLKQQLEATEPTELEATLDVSMLASGVYTLRASYYGAEVSARAVIIR